jgi:hypothetical protein
MKIVSRYATYANEGGAYDEVRVSVQSQTKRQSSANLRQRPAAALCSRNACADNMQ